MGQHLIPATANLQGAGALPDIWAWFCASWRIAETGVPLFEVSDDGFVRTRPFGKNLRQVLMRSAEMEALILRETDLMVDDWRSGRREYDGLIYLMFRRGSDGGVVPLYIGKAETLGKGGGNLSANISNLHRRKSNFARWGDNYAYHIGDLSAVQVPGHPRQKKTRKYRAWAKALFQSTPNVRPRLRLPVYFWGRAWRGSDIGIWREFGPTRLTFLEYLMIGVASNAFPDSLLNKEGRSRSEGSPGRPDTTAESLEKR